MDKQYVNLCDLQDRNPDFAPRRISRAVSSLSESRVIQPWRGPHNEIRMTHAHALLVDRLADFMRRDYGIQKAIAFIRAELAQDRARALEETVAQLKRANERLLEKCREVGIQPDDLTV